MIVWGGDTNMSAGWPLLNHTRFHWRLSKSEKKRQKKWDRRERSNVPRSGWRGLPYNHRAARFEDIRRIRLMEEEPDHPDLRPWRFRWAPFDKHVWMRINFYEGTAYEATCAGCVC